MKIHVQWSTDSPDVYREYDSSEWALLPTRPVPIGGEAIDSDLGWITSLSIQGNHATGDHFAVVDHVDFVDLYAWWDDPEDYSFDLWGAHRYRIHYPSVKKNRHEEEYWD